jgi:tRNA (cmo5U34)-methyltransferase
MSDDRTEIPFSFARNAGDFEEHIHQSIRGYADLRNDCLNFSKYFVENDTTVLDLGCSTGRFLRDLWEHNSERAPAARYVGIDIEPAFEGYWENHRAPNLAFHTGDIRTFTGYDRLSFVTSIFSLQFIPERDRLEVMRSVFRRMVDGGALIVAEKTLARSGKIQDMLTFMYYDFKRKHFSEAEILSKEQSLRDKMKLWSEAQTVALLEEIGFPAQNIQVFWRNHLFVGILAIKGVAF